MQTEKLFEKYRSRLVRIGIVKSLVFGFILGFGVMFLTALVTWLCKVNGLWIALGAGFAVALLFAVLLYFRCFRPTTKKIARLIDRLGLEERLITMYELERDESYIAMRQREDAADKLRSVRTKSLKLNLSKAAIAAVCVLFVLAVSMTTITGLTAQGVVPPPDNILPGLYPDEELVEVSYIAEEGGVIEGEADQLVVKGEDAEPVVAVADDGWVFLGWDDGVTDPERSDLALEENLTVTAYFVEIGDGEQGDGEGDSAEGEGNDDSDKPEDQPGQESQSKPNTDQEEDGDGGQSSGDQNGNQGEGENDRKPDGDAADNAGGSLSGDNNTVRDGQTDYRSEFDYDGGMDDIGSDESIPPELRDLLEGYYNGLK